MSEYFKKYTAEIKNVNPISKFTALNENLAGFLKNRAYLNSTDEILMTYWMAEYVALPGGNDLKKEYLDSIIEPKIKLNK